MPPIPARHVELEWRQPDDRRWLEWLASRYALVQYDPRGMGLSDRPVSSCSLEAFERDVDAVVDRVTAGTVALFATVNAAPIAIAYAGSHPDRISRVLLWCATPRLAEGIGPHLDALVALAERDWDLFVHAAAYLLRGWTNTHAANALAVLLRAALDPRNLPVLLRAAMAVDVSDRLGAVRAPTLVLHRRGVTWVPLERAIDLAAGIPDARLVVLEGDSMALWSGDTSDAMDVIAQFLGPGAPDEPARVNVSMPPNAFRYEGDYWTLAFSGRFCRLHDAKGLHHIAQLLARPGHHVPALELVARTSGGDRTDGPGVGGPWTIAAGDAGPLLDGRARSAYRERLQELRTLLADAQRLNDVGHAAAARSEIEFLEDHLTSSLGLSGRDRRAASAAERARLTVTKRIKAALDHIAVHHPPLGDHLSRTIKTGLLCAYVPNPKRPLRWSL